MVVGDCRRGNRVILGVLVVLAMAFLGSVTASADVREAEVQEYAEELGTSTGTATRNLDRQQRGAGVVADLTAALGQRYAGVWFDNETGEFVVPLLDESGGQKVVDAMRSANLENDFRFAPADSTLAELQAAQTRLDDSITSVIERGVAQTLVDPRTNSVVVREAAGATAWDETQIERAAEEEGGVEVDIREQDASSLVVTPQACIAESKICGNPMRGGVGMWPSGTTSCCSPPAHCTAGFKATGKSNGERYVLTAGHCGESITHWMSFDDAIQPRYLGYVEQYNNSTSDYAKIRASGTFWDKPSWPSMVGYWGTDQERSISSEAYSYIGQWVCHAGANSGASCGTVTAQDMTVPQPDGPQYHQTEFQTICTKGGDSGGPVFAGNVALGIMAGNNVGVEGQNPPYCGEKGYYTEVTEATDAMDVSVAPRTTQTTVNSATAINGNPGYVTVKGQVHPPKGSPVNNANIDIKLFKWENETWALKATVPTKVNNNSFEINNWYGVATGAWIAQAVFPTQSGFGGSSSSVVTEGSFTVKDGYRFVSKSSGKCIDVYGANKEDGASIVQWACDNPATVQNQVFGLIPIGEYVLILGRHSNRCLTVSGGETKDGAPMVQWTCQGSPANEPQLFKFVPAGGSYVEMRLKHSNKCLTVHGALKENGVPMLQWTCANVDHQKWTIQSVDSAPIPIETNITVPPSEVLNGQPGYVNVHGYVKAGAYPLAGKKVNVNYQKETGPNQWTTMSSASPTLNAEGYYAYPNMGVGVGTWRVRAVLPAEAPFAESASPYQYFTIQSGYRFIFRHSEQCMSLHANLPADGTPILQWPCGEPNPNLGQTFTLVPRGNGYYYVEINSTDKCVSVHGALQAQGTALLQWPCQGGTNQEWQVVPIAGQAPWYALIARHSGQCASATGSQNGASIVQWGCIWAGTQQWRFQPVN